MNTRCWIVAEITASAIATALAVHSAEYTLIGFAVFLGLLAIVTAIGDLS